MINLDAIDELRRIDSEGMIDRIIDLPKQCLDAWRLGAAFTLPSDYSIVDGVVVLGMGGSAIGGDLVRSLVISELRVPMQVVREYDLPGYAGQNTLVIASSYSGNTEETISAFAEALSRKCKALAITTGGKIRQMAEQAGAPVLAFGYRAQPRAALGYSFILLLSMLQKLRLIGDKSAAVTEAADTMQELVLRSRLESPLGENPAKQLAMRLYGKLVVIYGGGIMAEVARRWKGQINENSKAWSFFEALPELNHNSVVGYQYPAELIDRIAVVLLDADAVHPRIRLRTKITQDILTQRGIACEIVKASGKSELAQMMYSIHFGDFVSYYLAMLYQIDPTPVKVIEYLKRELAQAT